jgi:transposase
MNTRETRGQAIADTQPIVQKGRVWIVPSQSGSEKYNVFPDAAKPCCTCPDHEKGFVCKHIIAVQIVMTRTTQETALDGTSKTTTETVTVNTTAERKTYRQDWPKYNAAQVHESEHFSQLLADLCSTLPDPPRKPGRGRKPVSYRDGIFAVCLKVYSLMSARRFSGELKAAYEKGYIGKLPHFNTVLSILDNPAVTPLLKKMIEDSSLPLKAVESDFAIDSTGFATQKYASWFDAKYGGLKTEAVWVKAHFATGVKTNIVTAVNIDHQSAHDSPQFPALVEKTAEGFKIGEMSADKAYAAESNFKAVESHGGQFFPMFKSNATGGVGGAFEKAFHYFSLNKEEYLTHYHKRSNVETTVSMVKRKFGDSVKAKNELAQKNEVYAKFVCHNICVLIQEMYVQGITPILCPVKREPHEETNLRILKFPTN